MLFQIAHQDLLDNMPTDVWLAKNIINRHVSTKFHGVTDKRFGAGKTCVSKAEKNLSDGVAYTTENSWDIKTDARLFHSGRKALKETRQYTMLDSLIISLPLQIE